MENNTRKRVKEISTEILYEDDRYLVGVSNIGEDSHHLAVNDIYAFLDRGILNDLARRDTQGLRSGLRSIEDQILHELETNEIPLEELGWTLSKALVKDKELYAQYLSSQLHR